VGGGGGGGGVVRGGGGGVVGDRGGEQGTPGPPRPGEPFDSGAIRAHGHHGRAVAAVRAGVEQRLEVCARPGDEDHEACHHASNLTAHHGGPAHAATRADRTTCRKHLATRPHG